MSVLAWDEIGKKEYETGVDHGVIYPYGDNVVSQLPSDYTTHVTEGTQSHYGPGVAWNGLTSVTESPSGAEATDLYADNVKYLSMRSAEEFGGSIEAYMYPPEFAKLDGTAEVVTGVTVGQQPRSSFGFCYRTVVGNDTAGDQYGYKYHLVYGCTVSPSEKAYQTINDSPEAITFSWEFETSPVGITKKEGIKPTANMTIDTTKMTGKEEQLKYLLDCLYGTSNSDPFLPLPDEVIQILEYSAD